MLVAKVVQAVGSAVVQFDVEQIIAGTCVCARWRRDDARICRAACRVCLCVFVVCVCVCVWCVRVCVRGP